MPKAIFTSHELHEGQGQELRARRWTLSPYKAKAKEKVKHQSLFFFILFFCFNRFFFCPKHARTCNGKALSYTLIFFKRIHLKRFSSTCFDVCWSKRIPLNSNVLGNWLQKNAHHNTLQSRIIYWPKKCRFFSYKIIGSSIQRFFQRAFS